MLIWQKLAAYLDNKAVVSFLQSFLYAVVRSTAARILEDRDVYYEDFEPRVLPQPLCSSLSLPVQDEWWIAAYNLYTGKFKSVSYITGSFKLLIK